MIFIFSLNRMLICMDAKVMYIVHQALCEFVQIHELGPELLADARSRLIAGLKRYFHAKRLEGLLSAKVIHGLSLGTLVCIWTTFSGSMCIFSREAQDVLRMVSLSFIVY